MEWTNSKNYLQYPLNTPKYTTSNPYWVQNTLLFGKSFFVQNNLKIIIKIFSTIYLSLALFFPSFPPSWHHESWVHKSLKFVHDTSKNGQLPITVSQTTIRPLRTIFNHIRFYMSSLKVLYTLIGLGKINLIHIDIIFAAPNFGFSKRDISANNVFY